MSATSAGEGASGCFHRRPALAPAGGTRLDPGIVPDRAVSRHPGSRRPRYFLIYQYTKA